LSTLSSGLMLSSTLTAAFHPVAGLGCPSPMHQP
jgi:hypothetical protein